MAWRSSLLILPNALFKFGAYLSDDFLLLLCWRTESIPSPFTTPLFLCLQVETKVLVGLNKWLGGVGWSRKYPKVAPKWDFVVFQSQINSVWALGSGVQVSEGSLCCLGVFHHSCLTWRFLILGLAVALSQLRDRSGGNQGKKGARAKLWGPVSSMMWKTCNNWAVQFCLLSSGPFAPRFGSQNKCVTSFIEGKHEAEITKLGAFLLKKMWFLLPRAWAESWINSFQLWSCETKALNDKATLFGLSILMLLKKATKWQKKVHMKFKNRLRDWVTSHWAPCGQIKTTIAKNYAANLSCTGECHLPEIFN